MSRAVVLGGGGPTAFAWQWGVVTEFLDAGVPLGKADLLIGTSAGAVGATHLVDGAPPELLAEILAPPAKDDPDLLVSDEPFAAIVKRLIMSGGTAAQIRAEFCALALAADAEPEARLRRNATRFLPTREWPRQRLLVPAIDAGSGELTVFSRDSGVALPCAVAAACAVPGVWSPITIGSRRYLDAIIRSPINADLAAGYDRVVVIAPIPEIRGLPGGGLDDQLAPVKADGQVVVLVPNEASRAAIGRDQNALARRPDAARAGMAQARAMIDAVAELWHS